MLMVSLHRGEGVRVGCVRRHGDRVESPLGQSRLVAGRPLCGHQHHSGWVGRIAMMCGHHPCLHVSLLHMSHVVRVVPMLNLRMNVYGLLGRGETALRGLWVGAWGHRRWGVSQGRVHLLLLRVAQVHGLGCCCGSCCLVLGMLNGAMGRVATSLLVTLLRLSCWGCRGLRVLRVGVQGGAWVGELLMNGCRHIHSMRLLTILSGGGGHQVGLSMGRRGEHPCTALDNGAEHVLGLGLVVVHLLYQRLTSKLLGATGKVLGGVSWALCHNGWSGSCSRVHHCRRARLVMLVWSLLWHVWNWSVGLGLAHGHVRNLNMVHGWRLKTGNRT